MTTEDMTAVQWADLSDLLQGSVKVKKVKAVRTRQTQKEAFHRYMDLIYGPLPQTEIDLENIFDLDTVRLSNLPCDPGPCAPVPCDPGPCDLHPLKEGVCSNPKLIFPGILQKHQETAPPVAIKPETQIKVEPRRVRIITPGQSPVNQPKPQTPLPASPPPSLPSPPPPPKTSTPLPPGKPTSDLPSFLKQFADAPWFMDLFPDEVSVLSSWSPEEFSQLLLLRGLHSCSSTSSTLKLFAALKTLHRQGLLQKSDRLHSGLVDLVPKLVRPYMSSVEKTVVVQLLDLLTLLTSVTDDLIKNLLTLLAFKNLDLWEPVVERLVGLGVDEADRWLWPELDTWHLQPEEQTDKWEVLQVRADHWLQRWRSKYEEHISCLHLRRTTSNPVDVLNYFCSLQKEEEGLKTQPAAPTGGKYATLLPPNQRSETILRVGEGCSRTRTRPLPGTLLPPLPNRPSLTHFPNFISLPLSRLTLRPFHTPSDQDWEKVSARRHFCPQQSHVDYYR